MSKSYIPRTTLTVCTNMMVPSPQKLAHAHGSTVMHKSANNQLLNIDDRKLMDAFKCKNPMKFWQGLGTMLVGIGIGILIGAAIVASGGTALLIVAAVVVATGATCIVAGDMVSHDCDATKQGSWQLFHKTVYIDKKNALLQTSILSCSQGGMVSIVPDPVTALKIASIYAKNNTEEVFTHNRSQLFQGIITGVTTLGSMPAAILSTVLGAGFYIKGENESQETQQKVLASSINDQNASLPERTLAGDAGGALQQEAVNQPVGIATGTIEEMLELRKAQNSAEALSQQRQAAHFERQAAQQEARAARLAQNGAAEQAEIVARRAANSRLAGNIATRSQPKFKWTKWGVGIGVGIAGAVANFFIENAANEKEDKLFNNVVKEFADIIERNEGGIQGVNIVGDNN